MIDRSRGRAISCNRPDTVSVEHAQVDEICFAMNHEGGWE
jgi:hypothetical protein